MNHRSSMTRLRLANPVPPEPSASGASRRSLRRVLQTIAALLSVLVVGVGAAWAASGVNPVMTLFGLNVEVVDSEYGLDTFSILGPATQADLDALPRKSVQLLGMASALSRQANAAQSARESGRSLPRKVKPTPTEISAIGRGRASTGSEATVLVMDGEICTVWKPGSGPSGCSPLAGIKNGGMVSGGSEISNQGRWRIHGIVTDQVTSLEIEGSDAPPIPVPDNVFELRNMKPENIRLIGLDEDGNKVLEMGVPIASWADLG